ncbi:hypothetical protein AB7M17_008611 [Bradyrhizobium sp. USDA 377]
MGTGRMSVRPFDSSGKTVAKCHYSESSNHPTSSAFRVAPAFPRSRHNVWPVFLTRTEDHFALKTLEDCTPASGPVNEPRTVAGRTPAAVPRRGL